MTETESGAAKPAGEDRGTAGAGMTGDAAAKGGKSTPGDREASAADEDCAIDLDAVRDRAS